MAGSRTLARLADDGRILLQDEPAPILPYTGYNAPRPSGRLIDALASLLAQDLTVAHGACVVKAG